MDRRGIQTAIFFHWWPNHQPLLRPLLRDERWVVVYHDEDSIVAVRRAGNDEAIARARAAFPAARAVTDRLLLDDRRSWRYPIGRVRGLTSYADLLSQMGLREDARRMLERAAALR
jgi:hypothetical protein